MTSLRLLLLLALLAAFGPARAQVSVHGRPTQGLLNGPGSIRSLCVDEAGRTVLLKPSYADTDPGNIVVQDAAGRTRHQQSFRLPAQTDFIYPTVMRVVQSAGPGHEIAGYGSQQVGDFVGLNTITATTILTSLYLADSTGALSFVGGIRLDSCLSATDVYRAPGGEVYVTGKYFQIDPLPFSAERNNYGHYFLACLTGQGRVRWARRLADTDTSYGYAALASLQPLGRHGVRVFTGYRARSGFDQPGYNFHVADFDSAGRASRIRSLPGQVFRTIINQVYTGQRHYYFFKIVNFGGAGERAQVQVVRTDTALIESEAFNLSLDPITNEHTLVEWPDGGFYLSGITFINNIARQYMVVVEPDGSVRNAGLIGDCAWFSAGQHLAGVLPNGDLLALYNASSAGFSRVVVTDTALASCHPKEAFNASGSRSSLGWTWQPGGLSVRPKAMESVPFFTLTQERVDSGQPAYARHESTCGFRNVRMFEDTVRQCADEAVLRPSTPGQDGSTYQWSDGSTGQTLRVTRSGRYWLNYSGPCYDQRTDTVTVLLVRPPRLAATDILMPLCPGDSIRLSGGAAEPGVTYTWDPLSLLSGVDGPDAVVRAPTPPRDTLCLTSTVFTLLASAGPGCDTTARITVGFAPGVRGRLRPLSPAPADTLVALYNTNAYVRDWESPNANIFSPITDTAHVLWRGWSYPQTLTANLRTADGCTGTATYTRPGPPDDPDPIPPLPPEVVQNLITADGDGFNDFFEVTNARPDTAYTLTLHNRWGRPVFEGTYKAKTWPSAPQPGVYFYRLERPGRIWKGWVEVIVR